MNRLFCYGTLQIPEVIHAVTGRTYTGAAARLNGYAAFRVKDAEYPGIIPSPGSATDGIVYENVSDDELEVLDLFEGEFYRRKLLTVVLHNGQTRTAWVYVMRPRYQNILTDESWDLGEFLETGYQSFMENYVQARKDVYVGNKKTG